MTIFVTICEWGFLGLPKVFEYLSCYNPWKKGETTEALENGKMKGIKTLTNSFSTSGKKSPILPSITYIDLRTKRLLARMYNDQFH